MTSLVVVTASTHDFPERAHCIASWAPEGGVVVVTQWNGPKDVPYLGVVPAFRRVVDLVLEHSSADVIACLHDDVLIRDPRWAGRVEAFFDEHPQVGLLGFGGARGLGDPDLYQTPYAPEQLARRDFVSNLDEAEAHGRRGLVPERVACLDGFSQIGRRAFWEGLRWEDPLGPLRPTAPLRPWTYLEQLGIRHHFYDGALGCLAHRAGWETWYLPIRCHHYGGRTAVGDPQYQAWAQTQAAGGDHGFWTHAHRIGYDTFRDVLPLSV